MTLVVFLAGMLAASGIILLYLKVTQKLGSIDSMADAQTLLQRAAVLLHQIRAMAVANIIAFVVMSTLAILAFANLGDSNDAFTELNRVTICDLYHQIDRQPPAALKCNS